MWSPERNLFLSHLVTYGNAPAEVKARFQATSWYVLSDMYDAGKLWDYLGWKPPVYAWPRSYLGRAFWPVVIALVVVLVVVVKRRGFRVRVA